MSSTIEKERTLIHSVHKYLNYLLLRHQNAYPIQIDEKINTYKFYREFCEQNDLEYLSRNTFYAELNAYGIESNVVFSSQLKKTVRMRDLSESKLQKALFKWVDNSASTTNILEINGEKYHVSIKLTKVTPPPEEPSQDEEEKINI